MGEASALVQRKMGPKFVNALVVLFAVALATAHAVAAGGLRSKADVLIDQARSLEEAGVDGEATDEEDIVQEGHGETPKLLRSLTIPRFTDKKGKKRKHKNYPNSQSTTEKSTRVVQPPVVPDIMRCKACYQWLTAATSGEGSGARVIEGV